jgi:hypothetical protein
MKGFRSIISEARLGVHTPSDSLALLFAGNLTRSLIASEAGELRVAQAVVWRKLWWSNNTGGFGACSKMTSNHQRFGPLFRGGWAARLAAATRLFVVSG